MATVLQDSFTGVAGATLDGQLPTERTGVGAWINHEGGQNTDALYLSGGGLVADESNPNFGSEACFTRVEDLEIDPGTGFSAKFKVRSSDSSQDTYLLISNADYSFELTLGVDFIGAGSSFFFIVPGPGGGFNAVPFPMVSGTLYALEVTYDETTHEWELLVDGVSVFTLTNSSPPAFTADGSYSARIRFEPGVGATSSKLYDLLVEDGAGPVIPPGPASEFWTGFVNSYEVP